jgi:hypothetical protein
MSQEGISMGSKETAVNTIRAALSSDKNQSQPRANSGYQGEPRAYQDQGEEHIDIGRQPEQTLNREDYELDI